MQLLLDDIDFAVSWNMWCDQVKWVLKLADIIVLSSTETSYLLNSELNFDVIFSKM